MFLIHLPLEPYQARYTEYLTEVEKSKFELLFNPVLTLDDPPRPVEKQAKVINSGEVLDSVKRPLWALGQTQQLLETLRDPRGNRVIYFSDFYHPGLDALAYSRTKYVTVASFCWAQSFDIYDFTHKMEWMRAWETMAFEIYDVVFVASTLLKELITAALPAMAQKVVVVGLPFSSIIVKSLLDNTFDTGEFDVVYSSRWDREKDPSVFVNLVARRPDLKFVVCTGQPELSGTDNVALWRLKQLLDSGVSNLTVLTNLTKGQYFRVLSRSKVQFNCSLQDWVSYTLLEALTFGCIPLYPFRRSFPEALGWNTKYLYTPEQDILAKLDSLLELSNASDLRWVLDYHDQALDKILGRLAGG